MPEKENNPQSSISNEDRQAFGLIVAKSVSLEEAFQYPITTIPLAVATSESTLRQSNKASLRNYLMTNLVQFSKTHQQIVHGLLTALLQFDP